jgi:hypothetical protein
MPKIRVRIHFGADHTITGIAPPEVITGAAQDHYHRGTAYPPTGEKPLNVNDLPQHELGPCPGAQTLRREDINGDDGR